MPVKLLWLETNLREIGWKLLVLSAFTLLRHEIGMPTPRPPETGGLVIG